jgi:hypothetical protein
VLLQTIDVPFNETLFAILITAFPVIVDILQGANKLDDKQNLELFINVTSLPIKILERKAIEIIGLPITSTCFIFKNVTPLKLISSFQNIPKIFFDSK